MEQRRMDHDTCLTAKRKTRATSTRHSVTRLCQFFDLRLTEKARATTRRHSVTILSQFFGR